MTPNSTPEPHDPIPPHVRAPGHWFDPPSWVQDHHTWWCAVDEVAGWCGEPKPTAKMRRMMIARRVVYLETLRICGVKLDDLRPLYLSVQRDASRLWGEE